MVASAVGALVIIYIITCPNIHSFGYTLLANEYMLPATGLHDIQIRAEVFWLPVVAIIASCFYFYFIEGIENTVILPRLTKASFKLDTNSILQLWVGYFIGCYFFIVIYYSLQALFDPILKVTLKETNLFILGFFIFFMGRIVTKHYGVVEGRRFYKTILSSAFLLIAIKYLPTTYMMKLLDQARGSWVWLSNSAHNDFLPILVGSFMMATIGEAFLVLANIASQNISNITVLDMLPFNFRIVTGIQKCDSFATLKDDIVKEVYGEYHGVKNKLSSLLLREDPYIQQIFFWGRSIWIVEFIKNIENDLGRNSSNILKIIKPPDEILKEYLYKEYYEKNPSIDSIFRKSIIEAEFNDYWNKYRNRLGILKNYAYMEHNTGNLQFIIIEYSDLSKCIMFLVNDAGVLGNIVGIYTEESHIIDIYYNLFMNIWCTPPSNASETLYV